MNFAHLHIHDIYSMLDGLSTVEDYVAQAKALGMSALAQTNHGYLTGSAEFYLTCREHEIKPILGCEFYIVPEFVENERKRWHVVLLAMNLTGWHNLIRLSTLSFTEGFYYKPRITHNWLETYREGLICLSACEQGEIASAIVQDDMDRAREMLQWYRATFGQDFYLEIMPHDSHTQRKVNATFMKANQKFGCNLVLTSDAHYVRAEDAIHHANLLRVQTRKAKDGESFEFDVKDLYLRERGDIVAVFNKRNPNIPLDMVEMAADNTVVIASKVKGFDLDQSYKIPRFEGEISFTVPDF